MFRQPFPGRTAAPAAAFLAPPSDDAHVATTTVTPTKPAPPALFAVPADAVALPATAYARPAWKTAAGPALFSHPARPGR